MAKTMLHGRRLRFALLLAEVALSGLVSCAGSTGTQSGGMDAGPPLLTSLAVTGASILRPAFSPEINDYYVICAAGANQLSVAMTASTGAVSLLVDPTSLAPTSKSAATQTVTVSAQPNEAIVAVAQNPTSKAEVQYWVRCLPPDFPPIVANRHAGGGTLQPGYYLAGTFTSNGDGNLAGYAVILNQNGVPVWYVPQADNRPVVDVDYVVPGSISFSFLAAAASPANPTPDTPFTIVHPSTPSKTTTLGPTGPTGYHTDNHELQRTADGNYVALEYLETPNIDLTGLTEPMAGPLGPNSTILDCAVVEFTPTGDVISQWKMSDHFDAAKVTTWVGGDTPEKSGNVYDVFHCNSVDIDPANGNYLVSARQTDSVSYVDHTTGKVLWKLGGKPSSTDSPPPVYVSFPDPKAAFHGQHDARLMKGWEPGCHGGTGRVSVFDDETPPLGTMNGRGAVYNVIVGGSTATTGCTSGPPDGGAPASGTAKLAISYPGEAFSQLGGNVRFYDDGSRVVSWGLAATTQLLTEYDEQGNDLLDINFVQINGTYRGLKFPISTFDINVLRKAVGH